MNDEIFEHLADALDRLPNGFPRTPSNVEIPLLKKIFDEDEALLASQLSRIPASANAIAEKIGRPVQEIKEQLKKMAKKGLVWFRKEDGKVGFRLAAFVVGIFEDHLPEMDHEFAHLFEEYMAEGGARGIMKPFPALHRVVPARSAVKTEWVLPYDDVKAMLENAVSFQVRDCVCRKQQELLGSRKCNFPMRMCVNFTTFQRPQHTDTISKEKALDILDEAEQVGLVHTVSNIMKGMYYVCNCCGCCCGILRGINDWGVAESVAHVNYYAKINKDECTGCGVCIERCQINAIREEDGTAVVGLEKCIGCGLCVTGCSVDAVQLVKKRDAEIVHPPEDFVAWEKERLRTRGLSEQG
jgi:electron transport complex protein RnfB